MAVCYGRRSGQGPFLYIERLVFTREKRSPVVVRPAFPVCPAYPFQVERKINFLLPSPQKLRPVLRDLLQSYMPDPARAFYQGPRAPESHSFHMTSDTSPLYLGYSVPLSTKGSSSVDELIARGFPRDRFLTCRQGSWFYSALW